MLGIYDCFGYGAGYDVSFSKRYKLIKNAGFDCVMLWWSDKFGRGAGYEKDADYARDVGLLIENIHCPVHLQDDISLDSLNGEDSFELYVKCLKDCEALHIPTMVIHAPSDNFPINTLGLYRFREIIACAEDSNVTVAFENLKNISNLSILFDAFKSRNVGFCYDSCHHINYAANTDLLGKYGGRLKAVHLQDNGGLRIYQADLCLLHNLCDGSCHSKIPRCGI